MWKNWSLSPASSHGASGLWLQFVLAFLTPLSRSGLSTVRPSTCTQVATKAAIACGVAAIAEFFRLQGFAVPFCGRLVWCSAIWQQGGPLVFLIMLSCLCRHLEAVA